MDERIGSADTAPETLYDRFAERLPLDLVLLVFVTCMTAVSAVLPVVRTSPIRPLFGFLFVLFVPGYAIVSAFFPAGPNTSQRLPVGTADYRIGWYEWTALSIVLSLGLVSLTGYLINLSPAKMSLETLLPSTIVVAELAICTAVVRRQSLSRTERFDPRLDRPLFAVTARILRPFSARDVSLNVLMVVFLLVATGSAGYILAQPPDKSTSFYLLSENGEGELSATALPSNVTSGESMELTLGIDNYDRDRYTVVVTSQRNGTGDRETIEQYQFQPEGEDSLQRQVEVTVPDSPGSYELTFFLYQGQAASQPDRETAYRTNTLSITVERMNGSTSDGTV